ncbi:MAG: enoyl-CoA hydratase/isomerase family protein [bacterium]|nr:enoyl-CoA hydratase/isomerase family protein [bacterium]
MTDQMIAELVTLQQHGHIAEIVLNRPEKRNAMNHALMMQLGAAVDEAEKLHGIRVILIRGEGVCFSAGVDLMGFMQMHEHMGDNWRDNLFPLTQLYQGVLNKIERSTYPVIALLHKYCLGLGMELALACDFRIAAEGTRLGLPEARLGLIPDVGGTTRLTRLVGQARAKELIMTGRDFDTEVAERWGIVNRVVAQEDLWEAGRALADELAAAAPLAVSYAKKVIDGIADIDRGLQLEAWAQSILIRSEDFANGAQAMMLKQTPEWKGK